MGMSFRGGSVVSSPFFPTQYNMCWNMTVYMSGAHNTLCKKRLQINKFVILLFLTFRHTKKANLRSVAWSVPKNMTKFNLVSFNRHICAQPVNRKLTLTDWLTTHSLLLNSLLMDPLSSKYWMSFDSFSFCFYGLKSRNCFTYPNDRLHLPCFLPAF